MGDGSARHDLKAPGYFDDRAGPWDQGIHAAFETADVDVLAAIDGDLADDLLVAGRESWQVLAGAAKGCTFPDKSAQLQVPYGVGYHVVVWR